MLNVAHEDFVSSAPPRVRLSTVAAPWRDGADIRTQPRRQDGNRPGRVVLVVRRLTRLIRRGGGGDRPASAASDEFAGTEDRPDADRSDEDRPRRWPRVAAEFLASPIVILLVLLVLRKCRGGLSGTESSAGIEAPSTRRGPTLEDAGAGTSAFRQGPAAPVCAVLRVVRVLRVRAVVPRFIRPGAPPGRKSPDTNANLSLRKTRIPVSTHPRRCHAPRPARRRPARHRLPTGALSP